MSAQVTLPDGHVITIEHQQVTSLDVPTQQLARIIVGDGSFMMSSIPDPDERIAHYLAEHMDGQITHVKPLVVTHGQPGAVY